ncbi:MAG: hypothetical protein V1707_03365 [bacterium]
MNQQSDMTKEQKIVYGGMIIGVLLAIGLAVAGWLVNPEMKRSWSDGDKQLGTYFSDIKNSLK